MTKRCKGIIQNEPEKKDVFYGGERERARHKEVLEADEVDGRKDGKRKGKPKKDGYLFSSGRKQGKWIKRWRIMRDKRREGRTPKGMRRVKVYQ